MEKVEKTDSNNNIIEIDDNIEKSEINNQFEVQTSAKKEKVISDIAQVAESA